MDEITNPIPPAPPKPDAQRPGGKWVVKQYPRRLPGSVGINPIHDAIIQRGDEVKTITGTYDEVNAELKKLNQ